MRIIAHRGASLEAPENTLAAFGLAAQLGADGIEFDVQQCVGGELVVLHDTMLDRTTNGSGAILEERWSDVRLLDAGSWFGPEFESEPIPSLVDVLALQNLEFELELKGYGFAFLDRVVSEVDAAGAYGRIEFTSSNLLLLAQLRTMRPQAQIGLFNKRPDPSMNPKEFEHHVLGTAETANVNVVHVYSGAITSGIVDRIHQLGLQAHANDADSRDLLVRAIDSGADRLTTRDVRSAYQTRKLAGSVPR
jgi:glycerophosphoryl diester phosphodiesterase